MESSKVIYGFKNIYLFGYLFMVCAYPLLSLPHPNCFGSADSGGIRSGISEPYRSI